jgi:phosphoserine phosphatase
MTQDEIIEMAYEAGIIQPQNVIKTLEIFAKLVAQHEREACAKVCESMNKYMDDGEECATAIRERGQA